MEFYEHYSGHGIGAVGEIMIYHREKMDILQVPRKIPGPLITRPTMLLGQFSSVSVGRPCLCFALFL